MEQLKIFILASLVIIPGIKIKSSPLHQLHIIEKTGKDNLITDTLRLAEKEFEVINNDKISLEIKIIDSMKFKEIYYSKNPILKIHYKDTVWIAKGNEIIRSSVPESCDIFYAMGPEGNPMFIKENLRFIKLSGMIHFRQ